MWLFEGAIYKYIYMTVDEEIGPGTERLKRELEIERF